MSKEKQGRRKSFVRIPTLKSALKLKLFVLLAKAMITDGTEDSWTVFRGIKGIYAIAPNGRSYKMKIKSVFLLAHAIAEAGDFEGANWCIFRSADGIYVIHPNGKYYKINLNAEGEPKIYRGRNRIYSGKRLSRGYLKTFKLPKYT